MLNWQNIDTVLLDLDGTLLDLRFDNHFWLDYLPLRYAELHGLELESAKQQLYARFNALQGRLQFYCLDYWQNELSLDINSLKQDVKHLIAMRPQTFEFLEALKNSAKRVVLATNAHRDSLDLKFKTLRIDHYFDACYSAHDFGHPKEEQAFWNKLREKENFVPERSLFIDDNEQVLQAAATYGVKYLLSIERPDSSQPPKPPGRFRPVKDFAKLLPI